MEDGVRQGESRAVVGSRLAASVQRKEHRARLKGTTLLVDGDASASGSSRRDGANVRGRRTKGRRMRDGGLTAEYGMRALRHSHPHVYLMLVEMCRRRRPGRVIKLRRA